MLTAKALGEEEDALQGRSGHTDHPMATGHGPSEVICYDTEFTLRLFH